MNKYSKYSALNNSSDNLQGSKTNKSVDVEEITEQSTPKEMANFITKKLIDLIELELKTSTTNTKLSV